MDPTESQHSGGKDVVMQTTEYPLSTEVTIDPLSIGHPSANKSQLALLLSAWDSYEQPIAQKRAHSTTPAIGEKIRQIMRAKLAVDVQDGEAVMQDFPHCIGSADLMAPRANWAGSLA
uniref:Uncharacterized protein n=1 Tax=Peronospora matthiolae TaxID=2874970 RepID=A0AAV1U8Z8_9STRA